MKAEQLKNLIVNILNEQPRFFDGVCAPDFSWHLENTILSFSQTLIFTLAIFINLELLRISLWKKSRCFAV
ncbi:hypothetical protein WA1_03570 [Scytonema hofmannii PCC 7110]|uniref:Uncharacterized protein n=1 Tax=Scytonema hofmannii PCC 7110 TaxID=128403 RepID=A0A139X911_9CYAN|nr:hypothetical protein [Scytonema hofmannii]KYC41177.1 hypothetical protein WA1_03570 [Scytonema hofmannii PCC 7110]